MSSNKMLKLDSNNNQQQQPNSSNNAIQLKKVAPMFHEKVYVATVFQQRGMYMGQDGGYCRVIGVYNNKKAAQIIGIQTAIMMNLAANRVKDRTRYNKLFLQEDVYEKDEDDFDLWLSQATQDIGKFDEDEECYDYSVTEKLVETNATELSVKLRTLCDSDDAIDSFWTVHRLIASPQQVHSNVQNGNEQINFSTVFGDDDELQDGV
jgi:hypothetical protein